MYYLLLLLLLLLLLFVDIVFVGCCCFVMMLMMSHQADGSGVARPRTGSPESSSKRKWRGLRSIEELVHYYFNRPSSLLFFSFFFETQKGGRGKQA